MLESTRSPRRDAWADRKLRSYFHEVGQRVAPRGRCEDAASRGTCPRYASY